MFEFQHGVGASMLLRTLLPVAEAQPSVDSHRHSDQTSAVGADTYSGLVASVEDTCWAAVCNPGLLSDCWPFGGTPDGSCGVANLVAANQPGSAAERDSVAASGGASPLTGVVGPPHSQLLGPLEIFCYD